MQLYTGARGGFMGMVIMVAVLTGINLAQGEELVTLTMQERMGLARAGELVTTGVPLPQGVVRDADELSLTDSKGKPLPAEIRPIVNWPDGSLKWVHLYFPASCSASGKATVRLVRRKAPRVKSNLAVIDSPDAITVVTGPLKFVVKKQGFNLIDAAWIDEGGGGQFDAVHQVIAPHDRGAMVKVEGQTYAARNDSDVKVAVEESGPMHVVIKASGAHKDASGQKMLDFVARIYAYNNSPIVKVVYTFIKAQGDRSESIPLEALHLELPTTIKSGSVLFGAQDRLKAAKLARGQEAFVYASDSDTVAYGGALSGAEKGKSTKPDRIGWADISTGSKGLAAGVRWFWQMHPKSVEVTGEGLVILGLYPDRHEGSELIYTGVARTHYMQLVFHNASDGFLASKFAALQQPLLAFAPPRWYCRDTKAFGLLTEADASLYQEEHLATAKHYDGVLDAHYQTFTELMDGRTRGGSSNDDYGLLEWGDNFHYTKTKRDGSRMYEWNGNYYGYDHMMCMQFCRTGKLGYFDHFETHALHVADVHTVHWDPKERKGISNFWSGANRYCPPGEHVRFDDEANTYPVYVSNTFNHHKSQGMFERWYFLADHRMLDVLQEIADYIMRYKDADLSTSQPRGVGFLLITVMEFYDFNGGDSKWLDRAREVFTKNKDKKHKGGKPHYQIGFLLEGVRRYHEVSGDPDALAFMTKWCQKYISRGRPSANIAHAFGYLYGKTGDRKYLDFGNKCILGLGEFNKEKDFAMMMCNGTYFLFYLSREAQVPGS